MMGSKFWSELSAKLGVNPLTKKASTVYCCEIGCNRVSHDSVGGKQYCSLHLPEKKTAAGAHPAQPGSDLPRGVVAVYDNGGKAADRYTVYYEDGGYIAMSANPFHPQGFGQHGEGMAPAPGEDHDIGEQIAFSALPPDCQKAVMRDLGEGGSMPDEIPLHEARLAGFFKLAKPMGWGLYRVEDIDGGLGSIWSIEKDAETGGQFLIKKTDQTGEVMRLKTASAEAAACVCKGAGCFRCLDKADLRPSGRTPEPEDEQAPKIAVAGEVSRVRVAEGNDYIKENFNVGKDSKYQDDSEAQKARNARAKELRSQGYTVEVGKSGFSDLARGSSFWLKAYKGDKPAFSSLHIVQRVAVAPPGEEKLVKKLKKEDSVDNPFAVAWSIHNKKKKAAAELPKDGDAIDLSTFECVESDGKKATHLHGGNMGPEPCCGEHEDCGDASGMISDAAQLIQEIAFDQVRSGIVEDQEAVESEVVSWFESSYGSKPDMKWLREEIKKNYPIGQQKALGVGREKKASADSGANAAIAEITRLLQASGGYIDLDPLSVDLPGQPGRAQAISIEGGKVAIINCDDDKDCYWVPLEKMAPADINELLDAVKWASENDGLEAAGAKRRWSRIASDDAAPAEAETKGSDTPCKECGKPIGAAYFLDSLGICTQCVKKKHKDVTNPGWRKKKAGANEPCDWCGKKVFTDHVSVYENGAKGNRYLCTKCCDKAKRKDAFEGKAKTAATGNINGPDSNAAIAHRLVEIRKELEYGNSDDARDWLHALSAETPGALGRKLNLVWHKMEKDTEAGIDDMITLFREIGGNEAEWDAAVEEPGDNEGEVIIKEDGPHGR